MKQFIRDFFDFKSELKFYRFLFLIGGLFYYSFYHLFVWLDPNSIEIFEIRLCFGLLLVGVFIASYKVHWLTLNIVRVAYFVPIVVALSYFHLMYLNKLSLPYSFGYMIILGIGIVYKEHKYMLTYILGCTLAVFSIAFLLDKPQVDIAVFTSVSFVTAFVCYIVYYSRIVLMHELNEESEKLRISEKARMEYEIKEQRQSVLAQQMNPHFISNALNSIQYYILKNDKVNSLNYLSNFASLMRENLYNSQHQEITIEEEVSSLVSYIEIERERFQNAFDFKIDVDSAIDQDLLKITPMLLQPFIENSILHGLSDKKEKGELNVKLDLNEEENSLFCTIEDNGSGFKMNAVKKDGHISLGTSITNTRISLLRDIYNHDVSVQYINKSDIHPTQSGVRIVVKLPIIE